MLPLVYSLVSYSLGREFPPNDPNQDPKKLGVTGMIVVILSLSVLFITSLIGYFWVRHTAIAKGTWIPLGIPKYPDGIYLSTISLFLSSITFHYSLYFYQKKNYKSYSILIYITSSLAILFLLFQILNWLQMIEYNLKPSTPNLYSFTFYFLTFLHAIHVLFGFIPLGKINFKTFKKENSTSLGNLLVLTAMYWHFLDVVWMILFLVIYLY
jgi:cytochrome c oxidase subunit 3